MDEDPKDWLMQEFLALDPQGQRRFLSALVKSLNGAHLHFLHDLITPGLPLDPFAQLPANVSNRILRACSVKTALRVGRVCRHWHALALEGPDLWQHFLHRRPLSQFLWNRLPARPAIDSVLAAFRADDRLKARWMAGAGRHMHVPCHGGSVVTCLEVDEAAGRIFTGSEDGTVGIWSWRAGRITALGTLTGHRGGVWAMRLIPEANTLITGSTDRSVLVWDLGTQAMRHQMLGHVSTIRCLEVWREYAVSGSRDGTLRIWNWHTGELLSHVARAHEVSVRCMALLGDTGLLLSGSYDTTCALWDIRSGRLVQRFTGHADKIYAVACDPARRRVFSAAMDGTVRMWTAGSAHAERIVAMHRGLVGNLLVRGQLMASASTDGALRVWDTRRQQSVLHLPTAHPASITTLDMNRWVLASGSEGHCRLWDPVTGRCIADCRFGAQPDGAIGASPTVWRVALGETLLAVAYRLDGLTYLDIHDFSP